MTARRPLGLISDTIVQYDRAPAERVEVAKRVRIYTAMVASGVPIKWLPKPNHKQGKRDYDE